jgi:hypothetical protein
MNASLDSSNTASGTIVVRPLTSSSSADSSHAGHAQRPAEKRSRRGCVTCRARRVSLDSQVVTIHHKIARSCVLWSERLEANLSLQVKCDELHPTCTQCVRKQATCQWSSDPDVIRSAPLDLPGSRSRGIMACSACRLRKVRKMSTSTSSAEMGS